MPANIKRNYLIYANTKQLKLLNQNPTILKKLYIQNFSSYQLSTDEYTVLSYGLDHHIPTRLNSNRIHTEFEQFYQGILKDISHIPENYLSSLKTKLRSTCEKYSKIHVPYKYKKIIDQLSRNKGLCILKQDKGCSVVLMDRTKYTNKCLEILETNQFTKLNHDPTKLVQEKIQQLFRKFKSRLSQKQYYQLYPTGSCAGKFYGTAKIHKLPPHGNISNFPRDQ